MPVTGLTGILAPAGGTLVELPVVEPELEFFPVFEPWFEFSP
jgi:hypothetical protein